MWYTPPEIVKYMVARVDATLRNDLGIANGLADERVVVLDPCCGTGAYLVEVLHHIARTLRQNGDDALMGNDLKRAATQRVFGFELLPAPFVIAHLQMGLLLQSLSAPLADSERAGVYLTNALTGWEPPKDPKTQLTLLPELQRERDAAEQVKRNRKILVVLGNPPYDGYAGMAIGEERTLSDAYRTTQRASKPQGQGLNELYVRFFRMAERRIVEQSGEGVICFISNYSWLEGESHPGMREKYLEVFDRITIDCLNGDKYKTGKQTPTGAPDPSMFSTELNKEGIQVGTAIALLVRKTQHSPANTVQFRHLWGKQKRAQLLAEATQAADSPAPAYETLTPALALGLPFKPAKFEAAYPAWPLLTELFPVSFPGVKTSRDEFLVDVDHDALVQRMAQYFDGTISHAEMRRLAPSIMESTTRYDAEATRAKLQKRGLLPQNIVRYSYRPFDTRWLYWEPEGKLLDEKRADYFPQVFEGNVWIASAQNNRKDFDPPVVLSTLGSLHVIERGANLFPLYLQQEATLLELATRKPNISETLAAYLAQHNASAEEAFFHIVAVLHAPQYRTDNAGALRQDWPRISLPTGRALLQASAALGRQVAALLNTEQPVSGLTAGPIQAVYKDMAVIQRTGGGQLRPEEGDLSVTANWGHRGQGNAVMPGRGDVRPSNDGRLDVYLNDVAYWHNLPSAVWEYTIGGYQVIKKWLSYREQSVLGRALKTEEVREVTYMARRIAALIALQPQLDANYAICKT